MFLLEWDLLGWMANILFVGAALAASSRNYIKLCLPANFLYAMMYLGMGMIAPMLISALLGVRGLCLLTLSKRYKDILFFVLSAAILIGVAMNIQSALDWLLFVASIFLALGLYYHDNINVLRSFVCLSQACWIVHSVYFGVYSMLAICIFTIVSMAYAHCRDHFGFAIMRPVPVSVRGRRSAIKRNDY